MNRVTSVVALAIALPVLVSPLAISSPASALDGTTIRFVDPAPITVDFGDDWSTALVVEYGFANSPVIRATGTLGTVDIFLSGAPFIAALPIQADGLVYVSQPASTPLLAPGAYQISAVLTPSPRTGLPPAQTTTSLDLVIAPLAVSATTDITAEANAGPPVITASLSGPYFDKTGGAPAGTWSFEVDSDKGKRAFQTEIAQEEGATEPVFVEIDAKLVSGTSYTVHTEFTLADVLAPGVTVEQPEDGVFRTPDGTVGELLGSSVAVPPWALIALAVVLAGLVAGTIIAGVRLRGRRNPKVAKPEEAQ